MAPSSCGSTELGFLQRGPLDVPFHDARFVGPPGFAVPVVPRHRLRLLPACPVV